MSHPMSLREAERKVFRTAHDDGLWDILLGCLVSAFILALLLSPVLGDFWSSMTLLPAWGILYAAARLIRRSVIAPRLGSVEFGAARKARLVKFNLIVLILCSAAFALGVAAAVAFGVVPGMLISAVFGLILLGVFGVAAYFLEYARLYVYGLMLGLSPLVGEWLWREGYASHHGIPLTFGTTAAVMIVVGLVVLLRFLRRSPDLGREMS